MPKGEAHRRQRGKNYVLLAILLALVAGFYYLTIVKIQGA